MGWLFWKLWFSLIYFLQKFPFYYNIMFFFFVLLTYLINVSEDTYFMTITLFLFLYLSRLDIYEGNSEVFETGADDMRQKRKKILVEYVNLKTICGKIFICFFFFFPTICNILAQKTDSLIRLKINHSRNLKINIYTSNIIK